VISVDFESVIDTESFESVVRFLPYKRTELAKCELCYKPWL